jgi:hypothetical protein
LPMVRTDSISATPRLTTRLALLKHKTSIVLLRSVSTTKAVAAYRR